MDVVITFLLHAEHLEPQKVSEVTGIEANWSCRKGDPLGRRGKSKELMQSRGCWSYELRGPGGEGGAWIQTAIEQILGVFAPDLASKISLPDLEMKISIGLFEIRDQNGFILDPHVLKALGERNWMLWFDMYVASDEA